MSNYDDTDKGVLFKNERREKDTHPNLTGQINIGGVEYWLSGWTKEVQNGNRAGQKMISIAAKPKDQQQAPQQSGSQQYREQSQGGPRAGQAKPDDYESDDLDDDIPF